MFASPDSPAEVGERNRGQWRGMIGRRPTETDLEFAVGRVRVPRCDRRLPADLRFARVAVTRRRPHAERALRSASPRSRAQDARRPSASVKLPLKPSLRSGAPSSPTACACRPTSGRRPLCACLQAPVHRSRPAPLSPERKATPGRDDRRRAPLSRPADILTETIRRTHRDDWNRHRGPRPEIARRN
jgi:hypothetical protein